MRTKIKEYRTNLNLTPEKLADMVGVSGRPSSFWSKGNTTLRCGWLVKSRALQADIEDIFIFDHEELI